MSEQILVAHCAPTLAGLKSGSLFCFSYNSVEEVRKYMAYWNRLLNTKGVMVKVLRLINGKALIYVYRYKKMMKDIENEAVREFLNERGYSCESIDQMLEHLSKRITSENEFPHEIGLFLGYPFEDVLGFIENKGQNHKCVGIWKVYSDEEKANCIFELYQKCTRIYRKRLNEGTSILQLTVAV